MSVVDTSWVLRMPFPAGLVWQNSTGKRLCNNRPDYLLFNQEYTSKPGSKVSVTREGENPGGADDSEGRGKFVDVCGAKNVWAKRCLRSDLFQIALSSTLLS